MGEENGGGGWWDRDARDGILFGAGLAGIIVETGANVIYGRPVDPGLLFAFMSMLGLATYLRSNGK